ncbi:glycosyltransferase family 2 protein [Gallibacterium salpingitidis]|uniref:Glycosyltransferase 2-like domain-containing protein n=1 Tax=Gallibacterium salpingitidis TaxID=505341 RepID=A0A1A7P0D7_9PAST|nr:glycosyltransferase family 2 protein [Gallibacterium salpingitidis]OBW95295.1 hypothetical protein QS62_04040 [Gallibacterium salpingitidis]
MIQFSIIIPCYNEQANILNLVDRINNLQKSYNVEYILVDNGSKDDSKNIFRQYIDGKYNNIKVVYVEENKGYGYGIQQGMKVAIGEYIGWIHADMQVPIEELMYFFDIVIEEDNRKKFLFIKGVRKNRSFIDKIFTMGQSIFNSILFTHYMYDIGAIPVLFHRSLIDNIDCMPNDFSLELYIYVEAISKKFLVKRKIVNLFKRQNGFSSWNQGFLSKLSQSKKIFINSIKIKKGEKVL